MHTVRPRLWSGPVASGRLESRQWQQLIRSHLSLQFICTCIAINVYDV